MGLFEKRLAEKMQDPRFREGYREAEQELSERGVAITIKAEGGIWQASSSAAAMASSGISRYGVTEYASNGIQPETLPAGKA